jgi:4-alpha-glucanotransferase
MPAFERGRHAGVLVPLFSLVSSRGWGIGEIGDIATFAEWIRAAGHDFVQLLPVTEVAQGESSPYSALTAMAIDPIYISIADVKDFAELGGESSVSGSARAALDAVRRAPRVRHDEVRAVKAGALRAAFDRFMDCGRREAARARALEAFAEREAWWLDEYARFRAIRLAQGAPWPDWPEPLRRRDPDAIAAADRDLEREIRYLKYLQWIAGEQWRAAREQAGVGLFGDLPFMVSGDSADVWARQDEFCLDASVGTPPDAFSKQGQNWGLPVYRWNVIAARGDEWLRQRARRSAALYDGYRVDHLVGFYRTYVRPSSGEPYFTPADEPAQRAQGERVLGAFRSADALVIAEDLGVIPDFVRESLAALGVPGYRVLRWEREWHAPGRPFRDPLAWPAPSVAASGTHDTTTLAEWWETADAEERRACLAIPALAARAFDPAGGYTPALRDAILETLFASGSSYVITPIQDLFGWRDRINAPATIGPHNWTWRLPWPSDQFAGVPVTRERAKTLRGMSERHGRTGDR